MREKIVLRRRTSLIIVALPNGLTFTARYERISRKRLPRNIHVKNARKIDSRNGNKSKMGPGPTIPPRKKVRFKAASSTQERVRRIKKKYQKMAKRQSGKRLAGNLAKIVLEIGSKAVNSSFGRKLINKGVDNIRSIFKYGVSKIKDKNLKKAMNSDIANTIVDEAQNKVSNKLDSLF